MFIELAGRYSVRIHGNLLQNSWFIYVHRPKLIWSLGARSARSHEGLVQKKFKKNVKSSATVMSSYNRVPHQQ